LSELSFAVESAHARPYAAAPELVFKLSLRNTDSTKAIQSIALRCQIQIETTRRRYSPEEQSKLFELFAEPERWSQTLRALHWTMADTVVKSFSESASVELAVACSFDFNTAAAKYFHALQDADVPLCFMFSGTVFYYNQENALRIEQISWSAEARYRLPVAVWKQMMDFYHPNTAWLCLQRDVFERLYEYKARNAAATWEQALEELLAAAEGARPERKARV
jgi:hypothetical protein